MSDLVQIVNNAIQKKLHYETEEAKQELLKLKEFIDRKLSESNNHAHCLRCEKKFYVHEDSDVPMCKGKNCLNHVCRACAGSKCKYCFQMG